MEAVVRRCRCIVLMGLVGCSGAMAQEVTEPEASEDIPIGCALDALGPAERERQTALRRELETLTERTEETADGFRVHLRADAAAFMRVAEWTTLERRCCPFLTFELRWRAGDASPSLALGGRPGVKAFLAAELGSGS